MYVKTLKALKAAGREKVVANGSARTVRFLTHEDGLGFTMSDVNLSAGTENVLWYKNHWEANYIVSGKGEVTDLTSGRTWALGPGDLYMVGPNYRHRFHIFAAADFISVFCPHLKGDERHDADGAYSASGPVAKTSQRMFVKRADELRAAGKELVVAGGAARTIRMLTQSDQVGFGLSDVHFDAGAEAVLWYKHHWEANHILAGTAEVTDLTTRESWRLGPSMGYYVGPKDRHKLRAITDVHLLSIFSPALKGDEQHDADGSLPPSGPVPPGPGNN